MTPDLETRLRHYGDTLDRAASDNLQSRPIRHGSELQEDLAPFQLDDDVYLFENRRRRLLPIIAVAAASMVVLGWVAYQHNDSTNVPVATTTSTAASTCRTDVPQTMPDLVGFPVQDAIQLLEELCIAPASVSYTDAVPNPNSAVYPGRMVITQTPAAGTRIGSTTDLTGAHTTTAASTCRTDVPQIVPDLIGLTVQQATQLLEQLCITPASVSFTDAEASPDSPAYPERLVVTQTPPAGWRIDPELTAADVAVPNINTT